MKLFYISLFVYLLSACNSEDWIPVELNSFNCYVNNPLCYNGEGELVVTNTRTITAITDIYITEDCAAGWGSPIAANIQPQQTSAYDLEARTEYDVRVIFDDGVCDVRRETEIEINKTKKIYATFGFSSSDAICQNTAC